MNELATILGKERSTELLREAETARRVALASHARGTRRARLRQRIGRALVWAGQVLAGPDAVQPANGH